MQVIYRIKLPGPAMLGEGKPENQNHAIIFTRGEGLQTIDMNQVYSHICLIRARDKAFRRLVPWVKVENGPVII